MGNLEKINFIVIEKAKEEEINCQQADRFKNVLK